MPRDIPVGNGTLLLTFDLDYRIRDIYFPHVGMENHTAGHAFRFGIWADGAMSWVGAADWKLDRGYVEDALTTCVRGRSARLGLAFESRDAVDFHLDAFVRELRIENLEERAREVRIFFHHDFHILGTDIGDTAYFDPGTRALIHYKGERWFLMGGEADGAEPGVQDFATGRKAVGGAEGTWRDAEDGELERNPIAQGAVDSTIGFRLTLPPRGTGSLRYWLLVGTDHGQVERMQEKLLAKTPRALLDRTDAYWRLWARKEAHRLEGVPAEIASLFRRSLLVLRTQIATAASWRRTTPMS